MKQARTLALAALLALPGVGIAGSVGVGDAAPAFTLPAFEGPPVPLAAQRGKLVCVDFWASWCATCKTALPALDAFARRHPEVVVLAIGIDRDQKAGERWIAERFPGGTAMTLLRDPEGTVLARFGAAGMPALYLVDRDGVVRLVESGWTPERLTEVERVLAELATPR